MYFRASAQREARRLGLEFVDSDRAKPFFATYFMFWNHAPYRLPHEDISHLPPYERYRRTLAYLRRWWDGIEAIDGEYTSEADITLKRSKVRLRPSG